MPNFSVVFEHVSMTTPSNWYVPQGVVGTRLAGNAANCNDAALRYFGCDKWLPYAPANGDYKGTVVVMDDGLSVDQWVKLESGYYGFKVDIIKYLLLPPIT